MNLLKTVNTAAAILLATGLCSPILLAEPLLTIFDFTKGAYTDTLTTNSIVVTITRADQDPDATDDQNFMVDCKIIGGTAMEN